MGVLSRSTARPCRTTRARSRRDPADGRRRAEPVDRVHARARAERAGVVHGRAGVGRPRAGTVGLSYEEASRLSEADLLLMTFAGDGDRAAFEGNELIRRVRAAQQGHYVPLTLDQAVALQAPNVVSTGWLLDQLRPSLEKVAAGGT